MNTEMTLKVPETLKFLRILLGALAYAELGTIVPRSGSEYAYFMESFGPLHKFWGRLPAFLYSIIMIFVVKPAEVAVVVLTFSEYLCQPILDTLCVSDHVASGRLKKVIALLALCKRRYYGSVGKQDDINCEF